MVIPSLPVPLLLPETPPTTLPPNKWPIHVKIVFAMQTAHIPPLCPGRLPPLSPSWYVFLVTRKFKFLIQEATTDIIYGKATGYLFS